MINACLAAGYQTKGVDTHGLAQRGGVVVSHLRLGEGIFTPRISRGKADLVLALERLEAYRAILKMLRQNGTVVYYDVEYQPMSVRLGRADYPTPDTLNNAVVQRKGRLERIHIPTLPDPGMQNTALLGRVATLNLVPGVTAETIRSALEQVIKPAALETNLEVFQLAGTSPSA